MGEASLKIPISFRFHGVKLAGRIPLSGDKTPPSALRHIMFGLCGFPRQQYEKQLLLLFKNNKLGILEIDELLLMLFWL